MEKDYSLYIHTKIKNKEVYIGITCQHPVSNRWKNGAGYKKNPLFWNAIQKYGWNNFTHKIICENLTKDQAEHLEQEFIKSYKSNNKKYGYNIENGGRVSKISESQKQHLREINLGKHHTEETKRKMSISHIGMKNRKGTKQSEYFIELKRKQFSGENNPNSRKIKQYTLDGTFIKEYNYMNEAKKELNLKGTCHISDCCRGLRNKAYGYKWQYSE